MEQGSDHGRTCLRQEINTLKVHGAVERINSSTTQAVEWMEGEEMIGVTFFFSHNLDPSFQSTAGHLQI
jgi:hypothetical protein